MVAKAESTAKVAEANLEIFIMVNHQSAADVFN